MILGTTRGSNDAVGQSTIIVCWLTFIHHRTHSQSCWGVMLSVSVELMLFCQMDVDKSTLQL